VQFLLPSRPGMGTLPLGDCTYELLVMKAATHAAFFMSVLSALMPVHAVLNSMA
jgi:hypothetical protein